MTPLNAQQTPTPNSPPSTPASTDTNSAPVRVEGRRLFEVAASVNEPASVRAARISKRIENLISRDEAVLPFTPREVVPRNGAQVIEIGNESIMSVTAADVADTFSTPRDLALLRGGQISRAITDARAARANPLAGAGILIRNSFRDLLESFLTWLPRVAGAALLAAIFWGLACLGKWITKMITNRLRLDPNLRALLRAISYYGIWSVGAFAILTTLGLESGNIAAAVGISGFVLGFAFKDILSHFLAGLMMLLSGTFRIGDQIVLGEFEGTVERIELRALHLRTYDNRLVVIPNADVFTSSVTSNTASPHRRRDFTVGIGYDDDIERAQHIALSTVRDMPGVLQEPSADVLVEELAASTVNLRVRFYVNSMRADYLKVGSSCMKAVKEAFDREGVSMPTDIRTLVIKNLGQEIESGLSHTFESSSLATQTGDCSSTRRKENFEPRNNRPLPGQDA